MNRNRGEQDASFLTASRAFEHFRHGSESGNWKPFLDMMIDDYRFEYPVPGPFHGLNLGRSKVAAYLENLSRGAHLSVPAITQTTHSGSTTVFEFIVEGEAGCQPFRTTVAQSYDTEGDRIIAHREYIGDIEPFLRLLGGASDSAAKQQA